MKLAIMQPYFFPYIGYFQLINAVDKFVIYDDVQYIQRGWINRNNIISKDGKTTFTIPVKKQSLLDNIKDINVADGSQWKEKMLKMFFLTYKRAPYFKQIYTLIEELIYINETKLSTYSFNSIELVIRYLNLEKEFISSSNINYERNIDRIQKLNDIIEIEKADCFILPQGSVDLYKKTDFNIPTYFIQMDSELSYTQFSKYRFESNLSIIDALMFCSKNELLKLMNKYILV